MQNGALVLDSRDHKVFSHAHVPNSINIGLDGFFAVWVGTLIEELNTPILLLTDAGREEETIVRLARVGYENVIGFLDGGIQSWMGTGRETNATDGMCAAQFKRRTDEHAVIDVRNETEFDDEGDDKMLNIPLAQIGKSINELDKEKVYYVLCKSGYRSVIACSILAKNGFKKAINVKGGRDALNGPFCSAACAK